MHNYATEKDRFRRRAFFKAAGEAWPTRTWPGAAWQDDARRNYPGDESGQRTSWFLTLVSAISSAIVPPLKPLRIPASGRPRTMRSWMLWHERTCHWLSQTFDFSGKEKLCRADELLISRVW